MAAKKQSKAKNHVVQGNGTVSKGAQPDRTQKILNLIANGGIIMMGSMMGGLTKAAVSISGSMASGMAGALGGKEAGDEAAKKVDAQMKKAMPQVDEKMKEMVSDTRKDVYQQLEEKKKEIEPMISDPAFDKGIAIVDAYDFKLPKLTQELDDETLAKYLMLLSSNDPNFSKMFKELMSWMNNLPKPKGKEASGEDEVSKDVAKEMDKE